MDPHTQTTAWNHRSPVLAGALGSARDRVRNGSCAFGRAERRRLRLTELEVHLDDQR